MAEVWMAKKREKGVRHGRGPIPSPNRRGRAQASEGKTVSSWRLSPLCCARNLSTWIGLFGGRAGARWWCVVAMCASWAE